MLSEKQSPETTRSLFKNPFVYTSLFLLAVAVYVVSIFLSRHRSNRAYEKRIEHQQEQKQREADQAAVEQLGGAELAIQMLYATPEIRRGETAQVCFGVANAKSVALDPQKSPVWPSHNLCVDVNPNKTTTYTLTATGADGKQVAQQVQVVVR
jgi:Na+-transporting methylmalonyl-CoA/oxaloacetate decarboxylase gamma subunit